MADEHEVFLVAYLQPIADRLGTRTWAEDVVLFEPVLQFEHFGHDFGGPLCPGQGAGHDLVDLDAEMIETACDHLDALFAL